jgi:ABC-type nitrate/sulfonate/bicarbonate transport system ATPase subunit
MPYLEVKGIEKAFCLDGKALTALAGVSLSVEAGAAAAVVGPSGCGKTTLLRLIAGLDVPSAGSVFLKGQPVAGPSRACGLVFQEPRLFPWLTVAENAAFGLRGVPGRVRTERAAAALDLVGLTAFAAAYPDQLSGGMAQRAALARALAPAPELLLLDEPFAALDALTRSRLQGELVRLWQTTGATLLLVTHDIEEAVFLASQVVVLTARPGRVKEVVAIDLPYPRDRTAPAFAALRRRILALLEV